MRALTVERKGVDARGGRRRGTALLCPPRQGVNRVEQRRHALVAPQELREAIR